MFKYDIVLLTEDRFFEPLVETDYIKNILLDDKILTAALVKQGLRVTTIKPGTEGIGSCNI